MSLPLYRRTLTTTSAAAARRVAKDEGSIASIFTSLTGEGHNVLPKRFSDLKKSLWHEELAESWKQVLKELPGEIEEISSRGPGVVPQIQYKDINGPAGNQIVDEIRNRGVLIVRGVVSVKEALDWKESILKYASVNKDYVRGFPEDNIQVYEIYNSKVQTQARTHPAIVETQKYLLSQLWHTSNPQSQIGLSTPISYFDRLRIRHPGDAKFALGPHIDGGSVERWEDEGFRSVFSNIFKGRSGWQSHDPYDASPRLNAKQDMYHSPNACSIFRPWQGWTSLSFTGPDQGTLRVLPMLKLATAYIMLRPFFRINPRDMDDWNLDVDSPTFPGSSIGKTQELNEKTHPHLQLDRSMVSVPHVAPGDQVYWHCDLVHAVEANHRGDLDSSVFYIPAVPLTLHNATYLRDQRANFLAGLPPPDFPGGEGESNFVGRGTAADIPMKKGRLMYGLDHFDVDEEKGLTADFVEKVNKVLQ